jgi:hypothetical protein
MSWQKITLPIVEEQPIDPKVVEIGNFVVNRCVQLNTPAGFGMFHASRGNDKVQHDKRLIYLTPVAAELCPELRENYTLEPCDVPARDEPDMAFVFGDPLTMGHLADKYDPSLEEAQKAQAATESSGS